SVFAEGDRQVEYVARKQSDELGVLSVREFLERAAVKVHPRTLGQIAAQRAGRMVGAFRDGLQEAADFALHAFQQVEIGMRRRAIGPAGLGHQQSVESLSAKEEGAVHLATLGFGRRWRNGVLLVAQPLLVQRHRYVTMPSCSSARVAE